MPSEEELHADRRNNSAILTMGQKILEGMATLTANVNHMGGEVSRLFAFHEQNAPRLQALDRLVVDMEKMQALQEARVREDHARDIARAERQGEERFKGRLWKLAGTVSVTILGGLMAWVLKHLP